MHRPPELIAGTTLRLRRAAAADGPALFLAANDREVTRFMDWPAPSSHVETTAHLEAVEKSWTDGAEYQWVILTGDNDELAGTISCRPTAYAADFGYFLGRSHWGRGLAFEAASLVVTWLLSQPEIYRVWATADAENTRSRRLLERLGFHLEGILRMAAFRPNIGGLPRDVALYATTKSDA